MYDNIKMTDSLNDKCQRIMRHLLADHPIAAFFKDPVDTNLYPQYRQIIKTPSDISTIKKRLKNKKYEKLSQWNNDVELIFKNAEKFNGDSYPTYFAKQLQNAFEKLKIEYLSDVDSLTKRCFKLQAKLEKLLIPDGSHGGVVPELPAFVEAAKSRPTKSKFDSNLVADMKNPNSLSKLQDELEKMVQMPAYSYQILSILQESEPTLFSGESDIEVDIEKLKQSTITKLCDFVVANQK